MDELKAKIEFKGLIRYRFGCPKPIVEIELDTIMQLIEAHTAKKELEARIKELDNLADNESLYEDWLDLVENRITQLSSQLKESL